MFELPVVPLQSAEDLPATLMKFHRSFLQADASSRQRHIRSQHRSQSAVATQVLLPHCAISPPLSEHNANILSDLTNNLADLCSQVSSKSGQARIAEILGQSEAERIVLFWAQECLL